MNDGQYDIEITTSIGRYYGPLDRFYHSREITFNGDDETLNHISCRTIISAIQSEIRNEYSWNHPPPVNVTVFGITDSDKYTILGVGDWSPSEKFTILG